MYYLTGREIFPRPFSASAPTTERRVESLRALSFAQQAQHLMIEEWVASHLASLWDLKPDWDTYGGAAIDPLAINVARQIVVPLLLAGMPFPTFVPMAGGGVAIEWHRPAMELAIEVPAGASPEADATAYFGDEASGEEWEDRLVGSEVRFQDALTRLAKS